MRQAVGVQEDVVAGEARGTPRHCGAVQRVVRAHAGGESRAGGREEQPTDGAARHIRPQTGARVRFDLV